MKLDWDALQRSKRPTVISCTRCASNGECNHKSTGRGVLQCAGALRKCAGIADFPRYNQYKSGRCFRNTGRHENRCKLYVSQTLRIEWMVTKSPSWTIKNPCCAWGCWIKTESKRGCVFRQSHVLLCGYICRGSHLKFSRKTEFIFLYVTDNLNRTYFMFTNITFRRVVVEVVATFCGKRWKWLLRRTNTVTANRSTPELAEFIIGHLDKSKSIDAARSMHSLTPGSQFRNGRHGDTRDGAKSTASRKKYVPCGR